MPFLSKQLLARNTINLLRSCRQFALLSLSPIDYLSRALNGKQDFPPLHLRRHVGPLRSFESSGAEFLTYVRLLAELQPEERVLDVGCGCGLMALYLKDYLDANGSYVGLDIHQPSINWCQKKISAWRSKFHFAHIDVRSLAYNANGKLGADTYEFPYDAHSFDVVLLKSVFTHMRPPEVKNYLREVSRLLSVKGRCLATFFLLNEDQKLLSQDGKNALAFNFGEGPWRYVYENSPESATAYEESFVMDLLKENDLKLKRPIFYGSWSGRKDGLSFQDILLLERK